MATHDMIATSVAVHEDDEGSQNNTGFNAPVLELEEVGSGSKLNEKRNSIQTILELAKKGKIDKVVVQELSRLGRRTGESISLISFLKSGSCI